ncbi:MAG: PHP domain-containing protein [Lachnospiraceae bacterium]|nr:PHP domain-containing protein [Lachnospiraceae bacterium]
MKFDMHCHTKEGSLDGKIPIAEYIGLLKNQGFQGMVVTDHNSYNGYRKYKHHLKDVVTDFVVLKGIEYDTIDAGHIIVIMPEHVKLPLLECRGLPAKLLQDIVHFYGGILGPAHPCGDRHLSITQTKFYKKHPELMANFDFLEGFNACESMESNTAAKALADTYRLPTTGGSDSHHANCVGTAYTEFKEPITCESDLIQYVKERKVLACGGHLYHGTVKGRMGIFHHLLIESFWVYNHFAWIARYRRRKKALAES